LVHPNGVHIAIIILRRMKLDTFVEFLHLKEISRALKVVNHDNNIFVECFRVEK
jgi:hypothetical protein